MNKKILIAIIGILILAAIIGAYFVFQKPVLAYNFTRDLTIGSRGSDVSELQRFLKYQGTGIYPEGLVTGYFGLLTKAALSRYQAKVGISPTLGYFGRKTRAYLNTLSEKPLLTATQAKGVSSVSFVKKIEILDGARPEIAATDSRVFVVYRTNTETFALKIFDADMNKEIASKTLIEKSGSYGMTTDIRVASDGKYLYAFYEMANMAAGKSYLFGKKYALTDNFNEIFSIGPISSSKVFPTHQAGDEILDDPIALIAGDSVFAITRYKASFGKSGDTKYKVYEFTKDLSKKRDFDLDLSSVADGGPRQASAVYYDGYYYMVIATTIGNAGVIDLLTPSDLVIVKLDANWNVKETKNISTDKSSQTDAENYITGFKADSENFYLTYIQIDVPNIDKGGFTAPLKIYDKNFNLVVNEKVRIKQPGEPGLRPSLELRGDTIFVGHDSGALGKGNAEVYIYKIKR